jgi:hypothetical protein
MQTSPQQRRREDEAGGRIPHKQFGQDKIDTIFFTDVNDYDTESDDGYEYPTNRICPMM